MKVENFERQMQYLSKAYQPISLEQVVQHIQASIPLPPRSISVTFDDGYADNYENAYPVLKKYGIPAAIFLTTGYIGSGEIPCWDKVYRILSQAKEGTLVFSNPSASLGTRLKEIKLNAPFNQRAIDIVVRMINRLPEKERNRVIEDFANQLSLPVDNFLGKNLMLSWEEVREMSVHGISFGAHSLTHPMLTSIPSEQARREIYLSKKIIEEQIGKSVTLFAYPRGDFNGHIQQMVKEAGYSAAVSTTPGYNSLKSDIYALKRNDIRLSSKFNFFPVYRAEITGALGHLIRFYDRVRI
jgi:peptidoglycan/xylan/chitin deacetylase (PgdA/CDA1 family)